MNREAPNQSAGLCASSAFTSLQCCGAALLLALSLLPLSATAQILVKSEPDEIGALARVGMADFSLALLERGQPSLSADPEGWMEWQQQKLAILSGQGEWSLIIDEYEAVPAEAPAVYRLWLRLRVAEAYLALADGEAARDLLLPLIWGGSGADNAELAELRRLVILSYLVEGRRADAHSAMLRYEQDYSNAADDPAWSAIKARVMIAEGQLDEAALLTVVSETAAGKALYALALLKGETAMDEQLGHETLAALNNLQLDQPLRQELFAAALEKINTMRERGERVALLQQLLTVPAVSGARTTAAVDALWYGYSEYGQEVANRLQLLVGDSESWFEAAARLRSTEPLQAAALYVWLALHLDDAGLQAQAHENFVSVMRLQPYGTALLRTLYLSSSQYTDVRKLPLAVIYQLVDLALDEADLAQATQLMSHMDAPNGVDLLAWQLRRARLQILSGAAEAGGALLLQLVNSQTLSTGQIDYLLKSVFDLQNGNHHEAAYGVLAALLPKLPDLNRQRQMLYWMADSRMAQGDPFEAARLYLRSAVLTGVDTMDDWAQAARFQAAQALIEAGVVADGVAIYRSLLPLTDDPVQRDQLQREIQRHAAPR
ncbi:MAG: hypothetical protein U1B30_05140 [Pseudomonadota bacterium]|nr:hypothetical protein [Pseudomonadota bacterium]